jgi:uncharacterized protein (DUF2147 family)
MKQSMFVVLALTFGFFPLWSQDNKLTKGDALLGIWLNADKDAKFEIYRKENRYFGKIIWGTGGPDKDVNNPEPKLRNRPLIGLAILRDFTFDGKQSYNDGFVYDPKNGKNYACKLTLVSSNTLEVRGYVGLSLFGRTETWTRVQ